MEGETDREGELQVTYLVSLRGSQQVGLLAHLFFF